MFVQLITVVQVNTIVYFRPLGQAPLCPSHLTILTSKLYSVFSLLVPMKWALNTDMKSFDIFFLFPKAIVLMFNVKINNLQERQHLASCYPPIKTKSRTSASCQHWGEWNGTRSLFQLTHVVLDPWSSAENCFLHLPAYPSIIRTGETPINAPEQPDFLNAPV